MLLFWGFLFVWIFSLIFCGEKGWSFTKAFPITRLPALLQAVKGAERGTDYPSGLCTSWFPAAARTRRQGPSLERQSRSRGRAHRGQARALLTRPLPPQGATKSRTRGWRRGDAAAARFSNLGRSLDPPYFPRDSFTGRDAIPNPSPVKLHLIFFFFFLKRENMGVSPCV